MVSTVVPSTSGRDTLEITSEVTSELPTTTPTVLSTTDPVPPMTERSRTTTLTLNYAEQTTSGTEQSTTGHTEQTTIGHTDEQTTTGHHNEQTTTERPSIMSDDNNNGDALAPNDYKPGTACETKRCLELGVEMVKYMNITTEPCDDFYEFACGNWAESHPSKASSFRFSQVDMVRDNLIETLYTLLSREVHKTDPKAVVMAKGLFQSCMDTDAIEARRIDPLIKLLSKFGGWPVVLGDQWDPEKFNLIEVMSQLVRYGIRIPVSPYAGPNNKDPWSNVIKIDHHIFGLPWSSFLTKNKRLDAYENYFYKTALLLGANESRAAEEVSDFIAFESKMAKTTPPLTVARKPEDNIDVMTLQDLQNLTGNWFDWKSYLNIVFNSTLEAPVMDDEKISLFAGEYLKRMMDVMRATPKRVLANYYLARLTATVSHLLYSGVVDIIIEFNKALLGATKARPHWETCVHIIAHEMSAAVGRLYVENSFDQHSKNDMTEMVENIRSVFRETLFTVPWMADITREAALQKLKEMVPLIGYNDDIFDDEKLNKLYEGVTIHHDLFFETFLALKERTKQLKLRRLRVPVTRLKNDNLIQPAEINAFHSKSKNQIVFNSAILQPPYYHKDYPNFLNYARIGSIIGHEMSHGFDDVGRQYDYLGQLDSWWDNETLTHFQLRVNCIIRQYSFYQEELTETMLDGYKTQGENIADNGGLKLAYKAYKRWKNDHGEEKTLSNINLNSDQLFFVNYAQTFCESYRKDYMLHNLNHDNHSPGKFRVNGPVSNYPVFSDVFGCPVGTPMNPPKKCAVW